MTNTSADADQAAGRGGSGSSGVPAMNATPSTIAASTIAAPRSGWSEHRPAASAEHDEHGQQRRPQLVHAVGAAGQQVGGVEQQRAAS